jgi:hypothetical protein
MYLLFIKNWLKLAIALIVLASFLYVKHLHSEISSLENENSNLQSKLKEKTALVQMQNDAILKLQADYNASMAKLPSVMNKIETKYVTKKVEVIKWRDKNGKKEDCNSSVNYLNNYKF